MTELRSIYDYPEHLNPFYEKDNLKRLRFWRVEKTDESISSSRRKSFTFGSLKSLLPLKSFRLSKKSSALGINKTSESPPPLRKADWNYSFEEPNKYASYNPHFRSSVQTLENRNSNSVQSINHELAFGNRKSAYRSTVQLGALRKNLVEPSSSLKNRYKTSESLRSSLNSVCTNPFEDDEDSTVSTKKRKKRRAPLPPPAKTHENGGLKNEEFSRLTAELTAEFETFVKEVFPHKETFSTVNNEKDNNNNEGKNVNNDEVSGEIIDIVENNQRIREETPDYIPMTIREKFHLRIEEDTDSKENSENAIVLEKSVLNLETARTDDLAKKPMPISSTNKTENVSSVSTIEVDVKESLKKDESCLDLYEETRLSSLKLDLSDSENILSSELDQTQHSPENVSKNKIEITSEQTISTRNSIEDVLDENVFKGENEKNQNFSEKSIIICKNFDSPVFKPQNERYGELKTFQINPSMPVPQPVREKTPIPKALTDTETEISFKRRNFVQSSLAKNSEYEAFRKIPPTPPPRRRSIKDVIESINRNQQLLKLNQTVPIQSRCYDQTITITTSNNDKYKQQAESEKKINEILEDLQNYTNQNFS